MTLAVSFYRISEEACSKAMLMKTVGIQTNSVFSSHRLWYLKLSLRIASVNVNENVSVSVLAFLDQQFSNRNYFHPRLSRTDLEGSIERGTGRGRGGKVHIGSGE